MKLTKPQRAALGMKFGGLCAYCGNPLGARWHADHIEAVERKLEAVRKNGVYSLRTTAEMHRPERDAVENMNPSCAPCNIDKHTLSLEQWRDLMQRSHEVIHRDSGTYRRMKRYGLIVENHTRIVFHLERVAAQACGTGGEEPAEPQGRAPEPMEDRAVKAEQTAIAVLDVLQRILKCDSDAAAAAGKPNANLNGFGLVDLFDHVGHPFGVGKHMQRPGCSVELAQVLEEARQLIRSRKLSPAVEESLR